MRKGEVAFIKLKEEAHRGIYNDQNLSSIRSKEEKEQIKSSVGPDIYIRISLTNIKRDPKCDVQASWSKKLEYFERVRITGKELC